MGIVTKRPAAYSDMVEIWDYISKNSNDEHTDKFIDRFEEKARLLSESPEMGRLRIELMKNLRSFAMEKYIIFYMPVHDGIEIMRVLHGARDIDSMFTEDGV